MGGAAALPAYDPLQVVNSLDYPDDLLGLHEVEWDGSVHALPLWDDALGDVPDHRGLHEVGLDAVPVQGLLGQGEVTCVPGQGVLLVQGEEAVLQGPKGGTLPGLGGFRLLLGYGVGWHVGERAAPFAYK